MVLDFNRAYHPPCAFSAYATGLGDQPGLTRSPRTAGGVAGIDALAMELPGWSPTRTVSPETD